MTPGQGSPPENWQNGDTRRRDGREKRRDPRNLSAERRRLGFGGGTRRRAVRLWSEPFSKARPSRGETA
ncbi:hypothetical protein [Azospirillum doebereinerae]